MIGSKFIATLLVFTAIAEAGRFKPLVLPPECREIDVIQIQDMTSSFDVLWAPMSKQIGDIVDYIYETSSKARFGFSTFGDKGMKPFGYSSDYCAKVDIPLGTPSNEDMVKLFDTYTKKALGGGNDWREASLEGVARILQTPAMEWSEKSHKVAVMVTDALPHIAGDVKDKLDLDLPAFDLSEADLAKVNSKCTKVEYPTVEFVADLLKKTGVRLVVVASPAGMYLPNGDFLCWDDIWQYGRKYENEDGLALWYQDQFAAAGVDIDVVPVDMNMTGYSDAFHVGFEMAARSFCPEIDTTPLPVTSQGVATTKEGESTNGSQAASEDGAVTTPAGASGSTSTSDDCCCCKDGCESSDNCCCGKSNKKHPVIIVVEQPAGEAAVDPEALADSIFDATGPAAFEGFTLQSGDDSEESMERPIIVIAKPEESVKSDDLLPAQKGSQ